MLNINTVGTFHCCKAAIPFMLKNNYGRIVNIASIAGKEGNAGMLAYSASKAAVIGLTKTIGKDYADTGITCNAIAPGVVKTAMVAAMPKEQVEYMTAKIPMQRCGTLEEMAAMVLFIASKEVGRLCVRARSQELESARRSTHMYTTNACRHDHSRTFVCVYLHQPTSQCKPGELYHGLHI